MRWLIPLVLCAATAAHADGFYYTEGAGPVNVGDELGAYYGHETATRFRAAIGMRRGDWALEVGTAGAMNALNLPQPGVNGESYAATDTTHPDLITFGLDLKKLFPINRHWDLYLRGSASVGYGTGTLDNYAGRGLGFGAGVQLKGRGSVFGLLFPPLFWIIKHGPMMTGAVFADHSYEFYRLHDEGPAPRARTAIDAQLTQLTFGFALGSDF